MESNHGHIADDLEGSQNELLNREKQGMSIYSETVDRFIQQAALQAADSDKANAVLVEEFLRTG